MARVLRTVLLMTAILWCSGRSVLADDTLWGIGVLGGGIWRLNSGPSQRALAAGGQVYFSPAPAIRLSVMYADFFFPGSSFEPLLVSIGLHPGWDRRWRPFVELGVGSSFGSGSVEQNNFAGDWTTRLALGVDYHWSPSWSIGPVFALYNVSAFGASTVQEHSFFSLSLALRTHFARTT